MTASWDRRSIAEQARVEELGLADWLPGAATFAPHWAGVAASAGVEAGDLVTRADLRRLPPSLQGEVASGGGAALVQRPTETQVKTVAPSSMLQRVARGIRDDQRAGKRRVLLEEFKPVHVTRGGVGDQLAIASSRADLDRMHRAGARAASVLDLSDHDYLVSSVPAGPSAEHWCVQSLALGSSMLALHPRGHRADLDGCVEAFGLVPATAVAARPSEAVAWARTLAERDADVSRVVVVVLVGPPVSPSARQEIAEAWCAAGAQERQLVVRHLWAPDVHRSMWAECRAGTEGLHTTPDLEVLEVLDPMTGSPTDGGGDLTVTSMGWTGTTLLRYRTGHHVEGLTTDACPACGRTVPRIVGGVRTAAWHVPLEGTDSTTTHLDTRAVAVEVDATGGVRAWRTLLERAGAGDGYVVELVGSTDEATARRLHDRLRRATGVAPREVRTDADEAAVDRTRARGTVVEDRR